MINNLILLLKHDWCLVKNKIYIYILFFLLPVLLILFFSIPLSYVFINSKPIYLVWSTTGVCAISSIIFSFIVLFDVLLTRQKSEFIFSIPVKTSSLILSVYLFSLVISFFEYTFAIFLINSLNNYFLSFLDCSFIFLLLIPAILMVSSIVIILGSFTTENFNIIIYVFFLFIILSFGLGAFFPIYIYPENYMNFIEFLPISCSILNIHRLISANGIYFSFLVISIIYSIIFVSISFLIYNNKIQERLY